VVDAIKQAIVGFTFSTKFLCGVNQILTVIAVIQIQNLRQAFMSKSRNLMSGNVIVIYTGCLIKNASTHNFFICYPISMNKKIKDMVFHALRSSHKIYFFWRYFQ
jgi:hypothetical protein